MTTTARSLSDVLAAIARQHGEIMPDDLKELASLDRLRSVLVRCGDCRFACAAQDAERIMLAIVRTGGYVRDVHLPAA